MRPQFSTLDRYLLLSLASTFFSVFAIVISLMLVEHLPHLFEAARLSGQWAHFIGASLVWLLPEYAAIGLIFGLYLGLGMTIRRLSVRGELAAIGAAGIAPRRWMRFPAAGSIFVALLLLWTEGWLMPAGERGLTELGDAMVAGAFGYSLDGREFSDVGHGSAIKFERVNPATGELEGVFYHTGSTVVSAARGRLGFNSHGDILVDLTDGRAIDEKNPQAISFAHMRFSNGRHATGNQQVLDEVERRNDTALPALLSSNDDADQAMAWSRLLWPAFALLIPFLARILSNTTRGNDGWMGVLSGVVLVVLFIRSTELVASAGVAPSALIALAVASVWVGVVALLAWGERRWGAGYVDAGLRRLTQVLASRWQQRTRTVRHGRNFTEPGPGHAA